MAIHRYKCCICGKEDYGYGNSVRPLRFYEAPADNLCCDSCYYMYIVPAKMYIDMDKRFSGYIHKNPRGFIDLIKYKTLGIEEYYPDDDE